MERVKNHEITLNYFVRLQNTVEQRSDIDFEKIPLKYKNGSFELWRIASKNIKPEDKVLLIRAGIHGEEIAGPLAVLQNFDAILNYAEEKGIKLIIYPVGNPSGFLNGQRYNIDNDKGEAGNGDSIRYELENGELTDDLKDKNEFKNWFWSDDQSLNAKLPLETRTFLGRMHNEPIDQIVGVLDLHQDFITPDAKEAAYHYGFGDLAIYQEIISKIRELVPILENQAIGAGFATSQSESGQIENLITEENLIKSDDNGFIVRHDGSLPDLMYRLGTELTITAETTGATPLAKAETVNLIWIKGMIDLLGQNK